MKTTITKDPFLGWYAETLIQIEGEKHLIFTTCKRHNGVSTNARVWRVTPKMRETAIYGDTQPAYIKHDVKRATEKAIKEAHEAGLSSDQAQNLINKIS